LETGARASRARAMSERIANETTFAPIGSPPGAGVYPRLALLAPTPSARDAALHSLRPVGAGTLYPSSLDDVEPLRRFRTDDSEQPTARRLAARLMTLPTHYTMNEATLDRVVVALRAAQEARTS
jgi:dTDP-4-amino-4,6-dideoxygalactose transaminase